MIGIPLYADYSQLHDYIVQADNAFDDTIRGILNLKRCRVPVEIRVVIHRENSITDCRIWLRIHHPKFIVRRSCGIDGIRD